MTIALYALAEARDVLTTWLDEFDGELTPELDELLAELDLETDEKIQRVALFVRERLAHARAVKEERDRLDAIVKRNEKAAESLKQYLASCMSRIGKTRVDGKLVTVAFQANPPSVRGEIAPETLREWWDTVGDEKAGFITYTPPKFTLNRRAVLDTHKAGLPIPDGLTVEQELSLRIR